MLPHAANYFEFLFKNRSLLLALSALFREETTPNVLLIWIVLRPTYTTVLIDPHPHQKPVFQHDHCAIYEYDGTVSLTHSLISWLNRCIVRVVLVSIWSYTHISSCSCPFEVPCETRENDPPCFRGNQLFPIEISVRIAWILLFINSTPESHDRLASG